MWRVVLSFLLCLAAAAGETDGLGSLARSFIETSSPRARQALVDFAAAHKGASDGVLAEFTLGIGDYQDRRLPAAAEELALSSEKPHELVDYAVYYHAITLSLQADHAGAARLLADFGKRFPSSPLATYALTHRAEELSLTPQARLGLELLAAAPRSNGAALLLYAQVAARAGEAALAAQAYQRVYYEFPASAEQQATALAALDKLRAALGARYPAPSAAMRLGRADKLAAAEKYLNARSEYRTLSLRLKGLPQEQASVRIAVCDYRLKADTRAYRWLKSLKLTQPDAAAERLYHLAVCARRLKRVSEFTELVAQLGRQYPRSPWHEEGLFAAGNYFLIENTTEQYVSYYRTLSEAFPQGRYAALAHWKVAWRSYLDKKDDARRLLEDHIRRYPSSPQLTAAIYWLGRVAGARSDAAAARACYQNLVQRYPNYYYALLARERLGEMPAEGNAPAPTETARLLAAVAPPPLVVEATAEWAADLRRARLLSRLGLGEMADRELKFRAESPRLAYLAALELAQQAAERGNYQQSIRWLKHYTPGYLAYPLESLPHRYWELLFPLPWREQIENECRERQLDPYLVAAVIRQESEFNPGALSHARARGLMQILPSTGRRLGQNLGMSTVPANRLYVPETSLKLGTLYLRRVLDQYEGRLEPALAGYNAGEHRAAKWMAWHAMTDPAEFVENIPFTETRGYVQSVLRNAEIYRRLYGS